MKRSKHSLSHYKLLTADMGELIPVSTMPVLPGDTIQQSTSLLLRVSPLLAPVMHPVHVRVHHWFVPNRLVWDDWEDFITGGPDNMDASVFPTVEAPAITGFPKGSLADYLRYPTGVPGMSLSALPFRGYAAIWNEFYRDQDLQTELTVDTGSGPDTTTNTTLQNICWEKDYFTSSRPWAQKGPEITIPIGGTANVTRDANAGFWTAYNTGAQTKPGTNDITNDSLGNVISGATGISFDPNGGLSVDLDSTTGNALINELKTAFALQRYGEARAQYGSRFTEYLRYLGVRSSDARLQRPEYLGGGKQTIQFSEVLQTGVTTDGDDTEGVGNLKGHGIAAMRSNRYRRFFEEHGFVHTFISVRPKTIYNNATPREYMKNTKEDFWQKELQNIGQQEVWTSEIWANPASVRDTWSFQNRYDEYRRVESTISGDFKDTLNFWHQARIFGSPPTLNADFVKCIPTKRINAVQSEDTLWIMANHSVQARRLVQSHGGISAY